MDKILSYLLWGLIAAASAVGWLVHLLTTDDRLFLLFGAIVFPVGVVHGWINLLTYL